MNHELRSKSVSAMAAKRAILAEVLRMRTILLNFMLNTEAEPRHPITEQVIWKLIEWADTN